MTGRRRGRTALVGQLVSGHVRAQTVLFPAAATLATPAVYYAARPVPVWSSVGFTLFMAVPLTAWWAVSLLRVTDEREQAVLLTAVGGRRPFELARLAALACCAVVVALTLVTWPVAIRAFDRSLWWTEYLVLVSLHLASGCVGASAGWAVGRRRSRPATAVLVVVAALSFAVLLRPSPADGVAAGVVAVLVPPLASFLREIGTVDGRGIPAGVTTALLWLVGYAALYVAAGVLLPLARRKLAVRVALRRARD